MSGTESPPLLEASDSSTFTYPASFLNISDPGRFPPRRNAHLAHQFVQNNQSVLERFDVELDVEFRGDDVKLVFHTGTGIGAFPLNSPTTGSNDFGMVIKPRYSWSGIGPVMNQMGWRVIPQPLTLPELPHSEQKVPPWVLSSIILFRIQYLLEHLTREFEYVEETTTRPRGKINWTKYVTRQVPQGNMMQVPCRFPELQEDEKLLGAIHYTLKEHQNSLESQLGQGVAILRLLQTCKQLLQQVQHVSPDRPRARLFEQWRSDPFLGDEFDKGLRAIQWTVEEKGLAGLSPLQGIPWHMEMETLFEGWVETITDRVSKRIGGIVKTGRERETIIPIRWEPPFRGSQNYFLPDVILDNERQTILIDAKYKAHLKEIHGNQWHDITERLKKQHRNDLFQIVGYSSLFDGDKEITGCLMYPCEPETWNRLRAKNRLFHRAEIGRRNRKINLLLTAVPMGVENLDQAIQQLSKQLKS